MPQIGVTELILIFGIVLIIFGAGKLPKVMSSFGQGIREFRQAQRGDSNEIAREVGDQAKK